ncbi:MAG: HlyD family secretion protein [Candidatus Omnitrophota bacterium]
MDGKTTNNSPSPKRENINGDFNSSDMVDESINHVPLYRKKRVIIPFIILLIAVAVGMWYWYTNLRSYVSTDDSFVDADSMAISSKVLGRIKTLNADEGDQVTKGQIIVQLDETELQAQLAQARANLALAQESVPVSRINVERASDDFQRAHMQFKSGAITKEQFVHSEKALESAKAEYKIAQSRVEASRAQMTVINTQLQNTTITSPIDGYVAKRWVMSGEVVQPGQPILSVYDLQHVWVTAYLEETKLEPIRIDDRVQIRIDTYPKLNVQGKLFYIGGYTASEFSLIPPNNASGNFTKVTQRVPIKIALNLSPEDRKHYPLRPGMSVEIKIKIK